jgi:hypothetical protein
LREGLQAGNQLRVAVVRSEQLVAEAGDSTGTLRKGNVHRWKLLPSSAVKTVTENTILCMLVICKVQSRAVLEFSKSDYQSEPRL